jgi:hypothetical protein
MRDCWIASQRGIEMRSGPARETGYLSAGQSAGHGRLNPFFFAAEYVTVLVKDFWHRLCA